MRIAFFTEVFHPKIDGVVTRTSRTLEQLAEMGHEALIFATGTPPSEYAGFEVVKVPSLPFWPVYPEIHFGLPAPRMPRALAEFRPDVAHAINPIWTAGFSALYARSRGIPIVASFHTDVPEYTRRLGIPWVKPIAEFGLRLFHNRAVTNLVTSGPMLDKAADYGMTHLELWPKAVDTVGFSPELRSRDARSLLSDGHPDAPLVTYVGRISAEKDVERTLGIMDEVRRQIPDARLALVGEGPQYEQLRERMDRDWITFTGYLSGETLAAAFASGDVFLFPSTTETLGFVALESFASGVPVVGARAGGVPFVIEDGTTGFLVDPQLPDSAWAERVVTLLREPDTRERMAAAARQEAQRWSWRASTEKLVEVYEAAVASAAPRRS
ncbi:glycosyltransferase family 4 protein [Corynebacterium timonense]|uniref:Glycosyltransferase involved in cell wall bisynthesis n=1 Tax=Corynebacterium timonense TaxID=441500 RepID=A0A1H1QUT1_9CORY|nr:glycosyltransferase family 1 protein [Corynebacterium timonense]SDS27204.1 Glycosyltransferase involved in cell wall bisynthesis [Corynebacterium timonense]